MPRFRPDPSTRIRPPSKSSSKAKKNKKQAASPAKAQKDKPRHTLPKQSKPGREPVHLDKGKRKDVHDGSQHRRTDMDPTVLLAEDAAHVADSLHARAQVPSAASVPPLFASSFPSTTPAAPSPTASAVTNPIANIRHNTPLLLCIVIGAVVVTATLSVGLAWLLRMVCCASERNARRRRKLDRATWSPSALASANANNDLKEKSDARNSFDSVTVTGDDHDLERKDAKIDALLADNSSDAHLAGTLPVLSYNAATEQREAPKSTWNGKGWTLFDPPVDSVQVPPPAALEPALPATGGGNYGAAKQELADRDIGGFTWPASVDRQPSFIDRLVQRHHQASELPTAAPLPYPFQPKPAQPASRMASLGGAANRAVMNMLPVTLRNAATTASRQRATRKRYHDMQPYLDSDFEGTIGGKDRELPMARRLRRTEHRFAVEYTTEEESASPLEEAPSPAGPAADHLRFPRVNAVLMPVNPMTPSGNAALPEFTPGLAGVGAAWSRRGSQQSVLTAPFVPVVIKSAVAATHMPKIIEPNRVSMLPFPALDGDRRTRLLGSVGRWLGQVSEAGENADPYTALSPRPDRKLTKNGSLRSEYTSTTLADSAASNSETHVDVLTSTSVSGRAERLLQRVDADQAEHDRQQRRLLRKARLFAPAAAEVDAAPAAADRAAEEQHAPADISRAPSIRPQFCATTDLQSWLDPSQVSTTHGFKVLEEQDAASSVAADPFTSDVEGRSRQLTKRSSCESLASAPKAKLRSSGSKQNLRSPVAAAPRTGVRAASRQKRDALRPVNVRLAKKASQDALPSACQSSAGITVVSSVFDEAFAAANRAKEERAQKSGAKREPRRTRRAGEDAKEQAKAEADAAVRDAWRRRKLLSISSRGSQRTQTTRTTLPTPARSDVQLSRQASVLSQPSIYSELTAASDYRFQAPLLAEAGRESAVAGCDAKAEAKKEAKKEAKRERKRVERQQAREAAEAEAAAVALAQQASMRRTIRKQRSASLGLVRTQMASVDAVADARAPDSPWTSSDSDISVRRWGDARPEAAPSAGGAGRKRSLPKQHRAASHYYGMRVSDELRDLC